MCLIVLAYKAHPRYTLIVAANRDEFLDRPASPAHFWPDAPHIFAGRDQKASGTWLGITTSGRFAALTNYRDLRRPSVSGRSRGALVHDALERDLPSVTGAAYEGFNLIHGPLHALRYLNNIDGTDIALAPGIHGISNHLLDTPWPKVVRAREQLARIIAMDDPDPRELFSLLSDPTRADDERLPDTGLDLARERALSSILISTEGYGTRCSTVIMVGAGGQVCFDERTHYPKGQVRKLFGIQEATFPEPLR